jgi:SlyX protein
MSLEAQIADLETRLAFQDDTLQSLSDELVCQQRIIERLQLQVMALSRRQEELQGQFGIEPDEAPPPHY